MELLQGLYMNDIKYRGFVVNLQFFQGEKTEKATPKKKRDAREKGQVVQTKDIGASLSLLFVFVSINYLTKYVYKSLVSVYFFVNDYISKPNIELTDADVRFTALRTVYAIMISSLPFLLVALVVGLISSYMQVGFLFTLEPLKFKFSKISPLKGFKRLFSLKSVVEMFKSIFKALGILYIAYSYTVSKSDVFFEVIKSEILVSVLIMWDIIYNIVIRCSLFLLFLGILDFVYKKWENAKELKMSKQEVKDEYKQMEGDPFIKGKIKEKQREMAMNRMMQDVPEADVIITNPTHFAVAIKYEAEVSIAPVVVAKGKDIVAFNIKKIAEEHEVPIVENKPLARALYKSTEIGTEIPPELYEATADVLAYVYKLNNLN